MRRMILLMSVLAGLLLSSHCYAYDFKVDGIYYNRLNDSEVEVTYRVRGALDYSGDFVVPSTVTYSGITYSVVAIGDEAFISNYNLSSISLPNSIETIGESAFLNLPITTMEIPSSVEAIGDYAFSYCTNLISINIPTSLDVIPKGLFKGCEKLELSELPSTITSIGDEAFSGCKSISSIILPKSISSIGTHAFYDCMGLNTVISEVEEPFEIDKEVFNNANEANHALLMVPYGTKSKYEQFIGWTWRFNEIEETLFTLYTLSIKATGNGSATYNGTAIRERTSTFTVTEGSSATITFNPDNGNSVDLVKVNGTDVSSQISGNRYGIEAMYRNMSVEVMFAEDVNAMTVEGVNYKVTSQSGKTVVVVGGEYGKVLTVPATIAQNSKTWTVKGIENDALKNNSELAAIIWNPEAAFTASVSNPNMLLYVKGTQYAPTTIQNVVVNGVANRIVLTDAAGGNSFYCPQAFSATQISYTHNYQMQTGIDDVMGWETIALPFNVQVVSHATKGAIKPFASWKSGDTEKPFWVYELTGSGFKPTSDIKANTPYIISMPNNPQYDSEWLLNGDVTFAGTSVRVEKTDDVQKPSFRDRTFIPCFDTIGAGDGEYALNVRNLLETNNSGLSDGSAFVLNMRKIHPFEAYFTTTNNAHLYAIGIFDDMSTDIQLIETEKMLTKETAYDLQGRKVSRPTKKGVYVVNGKKLINR